MAPSTTSAPLTLQTEGLSAAEIKDRTSIQHTWVEFWDVYAKIYNMPAKARPAALAPYAVDPVLGQVIASAAELDKEGASSFGSVSHRPYWGPPVDGGQSAIMGDCIDTSKLGSKGTEDGVVRSVGVTRANSHGVFRRESNGSWRLSDIQWLDDQKC